ncbi:MAG: hypothetical protein ACI9RO_002347, partial [Alteromonas macleodii]
LGSRNGPKDRKNPSAPSPHSPASLPLNHIAKPTSGQFLEVPFR